MITCSRISLSTTGNAELLLLLTVEELGVLLEDALLMHITPTITSTPYFRQQEGLGGAG